MPGAEHHNRVLAAGTKRAERLEPKLAAVLEPILAGAGRDAARAFEAKATRLLTASGLWLRPPTSVGSRLVYTLSGGTLTADAGVRSNSCMVAVKPRPEEAAQLAQDGGHEPDDLHVTLAYLGGYDGDLDALAAILAPVANEHAPLEGKVAGIGAFGDNGNGAPSIYLPSVPGLAELRVAVTEALAAAEQDYSREHGWVPHTTTAYDETGITFPSRDGIGAPLHFDHLLIVRGNDEIVELPLVGAPPLTAAGETAQSLLNALDAVDNAQRELASAAQLSDARQVRRAEQALTRARKKLQKELEAEKPQGPAEVTQAQPLQPPAPEPITPRDVGKEVAKDIGREARAEDATAVERILEGQPGDILSRAREILAKPFGGLPDWAKPAADEIINVATLVDALRAKTEPVRQAMVENVAKTTVEGAGIEWDITNPFAARVLSQSASQITNIAASTQLNVMRIIDASHDAGLSIPDTAKAIRVGMQAASESRAVMIARTEMARAVQGGALAATQIVQSATGEAMLKTWLTAPGAVHPRHEDYDGLDEQTQQLDDYFDVGGAQLQYPSDPDGPPDETISCRCSLVFVTAEDAADQGIEVGGTSAAPPVATPEEAQQQLARPEFAPTPEPEGTVTTDDPAVAAQALWRGTQVVLRQPTEVATLIDDLGALAKEAQAKGEIAPTLDLGKVSVPGTNLFTQQSLGVPRVEMPQLKGVPLPGSLADAMARDSRGEVDIGPLFYQHLRDEGVKIDEGVVQDVANLRATQTELDGAKVAGIMDYLEGGGAIEGSIPVTQDGYVIDGHHRWAAEIGLDYKSDADKPWTIATDVVHEDITHVINDANLFAAQYGLPQASAFVQQLGKAPTGAVTVGITPFRKGDEALRSVFYDTEKAKQFEADTQSFAREFGVTVDETERTLGVWEGEQEPSYSLTVHDGDGIERWAAALRAKYDQDGVLLFTSEAPADSFTYTIHRVDDVEAAFAKLKDHGIDGATAVGNDLKIVGPATLVEDVKRFADDLGSIVTADRGTMTFVSRGDAPRSLLEVNVLHPNVELYAGEHDGGIAVSLIRVPTDLQGKGEAAAAMADLLRYADRRGLTVALTPERVGGGMGVTQLRAWYRRLGFVPNRGRAADLRFSESFVRPPQGTLARPEFAADPVRQALTAYAEAVRSLAADDYIARETARTAGRTADVERLTQHRRDLNDLIAHPYPEEELVVARNEQLQIEGAIRSGKLAGDDLAAAQAQADKLGEDIDVLAHLRNSSAYADTESARRALAAAFEAKAETAKAANVARADSSLREKLAAVADNEPVALAARTVDWSANGNYDAGPSVAWKHGGLTFTAELRNAQDTPERAAAFYQRKLSPWISDLPPEIRGRLQRVNVYNGVDPDEAYWARVLHQEGSILAATSPADGTINFWHSNEALAKQSLTQSTLDHESGHLMFGGGGPSDTNRWLDAANADTRRARSIYGLGDSDMPLEGKTPGSFRGFLVGVRGVSDYGAADPAEDWAESIRLYLRDRREGSIGTLTVDGKEQTARFADIYPNRAKLIDEWLHTAPVETAAPAAAVRPLFAPRALAAPDPQQELALAPGRAGKEVAVGDLLEGDSFTQERDGAKVSYRITSIDRVGGKPSSVTAVVIGSNDPVRALGESVTMDPQAKGTVAHEVLGMNYDVERQQAQAALAGGLEKYAVDIIGPPVPSGVLASSRAARQAKIEVAETLAARLADDPTWKQAVKEPTLATIAELKPGQTFRYGDSLTTFRFVKDEAEVRNDSRDFTVEVVSPGPLSNYEGRVGTQQRFVLATDEKVALVEGERYPFPVHTDIDLAPGATGYLPYDQNATAGLVDGWAATSADENPWALALQRATNDEFGQGPEPLKVFSQRGDAVKQADAIYQEKGAALRKFVRAQYDQTQTFLKERGITELTLYRGMGDIPKSVPRGMSKQALQLQPASSFAADMRTAAAFATLAESPGLIAAKVPADRILATPRSGWGSLKEKEFVVLAPPEGAANDQALVWRSAPLPPTLYEFWENAKEMKQ